MTLLDKPLLSDELVSAILSAIGVLISVAISLVLFFLWLKVKYWGEGKERKKSVIK